MVPSSKAFDIVASLAIKLGFLVGFAALAADTPPSELEAPRGDASVAYWQAVARHSIESDVAYFDPARPAPNPDPGASAERLVNRQNRESIVFNGRGPFILVFVALCLTVVAFALAFGMKPRVGIASRSKGWLRTREPNEVAEEAHESAAVSSLEAISRMADRREALIALARIALSRSFETHGLLLGRSWTMRDAVTRIPPTWPHRDRLVEIALASEVAHFGGRTVSEDAFQRHLASTAAILKAGTA